MRAQNSGPGIHTVKAFSVGLVPDNYSLVLTAWRLNGTVYKYLIGAFLFTSARGNKLLYIAYTYDANGILWEPIKAKTLEK